ncbi:uncharacterized protein LOC143204908 [Rhynchophorus ferrugineus]|uniref:uncharacterized protein LOC143204908 n=1 Tax=Rhynchophorus ferrugineus TaxID=354439 RepID=UPI003FCE44E1
MSSYIPTKRHFQEVLLLLFNSKKSVDESHRMLLETYSEHAPTIETCEHWFQRFRGGDFNTADEPKQHEENNKVATELKTKERVHNGERPFLCPHCHKAFSRHGNLKHHIKKNHRLAQSEDESLYNIGQVEILNQNSDLLEEPLPVRREDLIPKNYKRLPLDESGNSQKPLIKRPRKCQNLSPMASLNADEKSTSMQSTENYNITNMPFGDLEYLTKTDNEQGNVSVMHGDVIEPLVEIKIEQSD